MIPEMFPTGLDVLTFRTEGGRAWAIREGVNPRTAPGATTTTPRWVRGGQGDRGLMQVLEEI